MKSFLDKYYNIIILSIYALVLLLRVYNLEQKNLWFDEIFSWHLSQKTFAGIINGTAGDIHPPLFYFMLKLWSTLFGESVFALRMLSVICSLIASVVFFNILNLITQERYAILFGMFMYAISPVNIYYSQEVRMLNLNLLFALLSVYYFLKNREQYSQIYSVLYILFTVAAIYTHYFSFLILLTQMIITGYDFTRNRTGKIFKYILNFIITILLYAPWFWTMIRQLMKGQEWRTPQTASMVFSNTIAFFNDVFFSYYVYYQTILPLNIIEGLSLLMLLISLFLPLYFYFIGKNDSVFIVSLFFTVPFVTAVLVSINNSILLSRYLSILIPYLIASFIGFIICVRFSIVRILFSSFLIFVSLTGMIFNYSYDFKNNDYRELTSYLNSNAQDDELISVEPHYMAGTFYITQKQIM